MNVSACKTGINIERSGSPEHLVYFSFLFPARKRNRDKQISKVLERFIDRFGIKIDLTSKLFVC